MAFDAQIAVLTIYAEASSASQAEREAVAHVILNRKKDPRWASQTIAEICTDYMQFSSWNGDKGDRSNLLRAMRTPESDPVMNSCMAAWAMAKNLPDTTGGATHYTDKTIEPPSWAQGAELALETDKFRFYRSVK